MGRWLRTIVVVSSLAIAITVLVLTQRSRRLDFLVSWARAGQYYEIRLHRGELHYLSNVWPVDETARWGWRDAAELREYPALQGQAMYGLHDGNWLHLVPARGGPGSWWKTSGSTFVYGRSREMQKHVPATAATTTKRVITTAPTPKPFNFDVMSMPTFVRPTPGTSNRMADDAVKEFRQSSEMTLVSKAPPPKSAADGFLMLSARGRATSYTFERYAISAWWIIAAALTPVWWIVALALVRWFTRIRRRRAGLCLACGYDLRATPGTCPECGQVRRGAMA